MIPDTHSPPQKNDLSADGDPRRPDKASKTNVPTSSVHGWRVGSELVGGLIAGIILGWGVDAIGNTKPWGIIIGMILGCCAGVWTVYKNAMAMGNDDGAGTP